MTERNPERSTGPRTSQETLSRIGRGLFIKVSKEAPASSLGQAALIAEYCIRHNLDPLKLSSAVMGNENALRVIADRANRTHARRGADVGSLDTLAARTQVDFDFTIAAGLKMNTPLRQRYLAYVPGQGKK